VHVVDFGRYRLRLGLECPLVGTEERTRRAFDVYSAELVRDDEMICAATEVYFVRIDDPGADHARAAVAIGSEFLLKVCCEALDRRGHLREHVEEIFADALTEVFVLERIQVRSSDADKPILRGMFVQAIFSTLSRGMDILFVSATQGELAPALPGRHPEGPAGYLRRGFVFSASRGSPTDRLDTRHEPHQPTLYLSEKPDRARLPSRTAGGWRDLMDLDRPTGRGTDA